MTVHPVDMNVFTKCHNYGHLFNHFIDQTLTHSTWGEIYFKEPGSKGLFRSSRLNFELNEWVWTFTLNMEWFSLLVLLPLKSLLHSVWCDFHVRLLLDPWTTHSLLVNGFDSQFLWLIDQDVMNSTVRKKQETGDILQKDTFFDMMTEMSFTLSTQYDPYLCVHPVWCTLDPTEGLPILAQSCSLPLVLARDSASRLTCSGPRPPKICPHGPDT